MSKTKANKNMYVFHINHVIICICNSLKCWFKHPLPYMFLLAWFGFVWHSWFASLPWGDLVVRCSWIYSIVVPTETLLFVDLGFENLLLLLACLHHNPCCVDASSLHQPLFAHLCGHDLVCSQGSAPCWLQQGSTSLKPFLPIWTLCSPLTPHFTPRRMVHGDYHYFHPFMKALLDISTLFDVKFCFIILC